MDIGYTWIYLQRKIYGPFSSLIWTSVIGHIVHPIREERDDLNVGYRYFSQLGVHYNEVHENLLLHPINKISINLTSFIMDLRSVVALN